MKKLFGFLSAIVFTLNVFSQTPNWGWVNAAGGPGSDVGWCIATDNLGYSYIAATLGASIAITKYDAGGAIVWVEQITGSGSKRALDIILGDNSNIYLTGFFSFSATFDNITLNSAGANDIFIAKYDSSGNIIWAQRTGGSGSESGVGISLDGHGSCYISGDFLNSAIIGNNSFLSYGVYDVFIARYDTSGNFIWARQAGSNSYDYNSGIASDAYGNSYMAARFPSTATFDSTNVINGGPVVIAKYDYTGNVVWVRAAVAPTGGRVTCITADSLGNSFISGDFSVSIIFGTDTLISSPNGPSFFVAKYDSAGNNIWAETNSGTSYQVSGKNIHRDNSENIFVTGLFTDTSVFGTDTIISNGATDIFVAKYDLLGNYICVNNAGGSDYDEPWSISADGVGNCYVTGSFRDTALFGSFNLITMGNDDYFVAKLGDSSIVTNTPIVLNPRENISILPNPASREIILSVRNNVKANTRASIYNFLGAEILTTPITNTQTNINIRSLPPGVYFINVKEEGKSLGTKKFVKM